MLKGLSIGIVMILFCLPVVAENKATTNAHQNDTSEQPNLTSAYKKLLHSTGQRYEPLSIWAEDEANLKLLESIEDELPVTDLVTGETEFIKAKQLIDNKFENVWAIMPEAAVNTITQVEPNIDSLPPLVKSSSENSEVNTNPQPINSAHWNGDLVMYLGGMILVFGLGMLVISLLMLKAGMSVHGLVRLNGLILVIISAVFLIIVGYSQEQIAPVIGLFGAIAGYLLGNAKEPAP